MGNGVVRGSSTASAKVNKMADSSVDPPGSASNSPVMDRVKKILNSPLTRRKNSQKYFGIHVEELSKREDSNIPMLVRRVCTYIINKGLDQEGLFRINGNSKVVEQMRVSFNKHGDADLEECDDVMAAASLLKLFLRELPDTVIPESMTRMFTMALQESSGNRELFITKTKSLLSKLPEPNYSILKYLCRFLVKVSSKEQLNKMNPTSLGIVFGPNIFSGTFHGDNRCTSSIAGLKEQSSTNEIVKRLIQDYDTYFLKDGERSPNDTTFVQTPVKVAPVRPPPPKIEPVSHSPVPSTRKTVTKEMVAPTGVRNANNNEGLESGEGTPRFSDSETPRFSEDEFIDTARPHSPFALDSDRSEISVVHSPIPPGVTDTDRPRVVEKVISSTISERLFGSGDQSDDSSTSTTKNTHHREPVPAPRKKKSESVQQPLSNSPLHVPDEDIIDLPESDDDDGVLGLLMDSSKPKRQKASVLGLIESYGSLDAQEKLSPGRPLPKPRQAKQASGSLDHGMREDLPRTTPIVERLKQAAATAEKKTPTRRSLKLILDAHGGGATNMGDQDDGEMLAEPAWDGEDADENHNDTKPSMRFLDHHSTNGEGLQRSPERSPLDARKPYVPPLDLTILHEHGDGSVPIPAQHGPSLAYQKAKTYKESSDDAILSPRTLKLKKKREESASAPLATPSRDQPPSPSAFRCISQSESANCDTDIPPSPPTDQPVSFSGHRPMADEHTMQIKQFNRKIQMLKKKIKLFEEDFEDRNGYRPSHGNKAADPEIKKALLELTRVRKELKTLKEEAENERMPSLTVTPAPSLEEEGLLGIGKPTMSETLDSLLLKLSHKREDSGRPSDLMIMNSEQIKEEKLAVQKALLHFENLHGRPVTKPEKELMKPLYDRYRTVKRIMSKPSSPRDGAMELQPVPEEHTMDFSPSTASSNQSSNRDPIKIPVCSPDVEHEDFLVTHDFGTLRDVTQPDPNNHQGEPEVRQNNRTFKQAEQMMNEENIISEKSKESYLHEMSMNQLFDEQSKAKSDKKRLRKKLREFEDTFFRQNGRKVLKEDRTPMEAEYQDYKQVKARLKLLDALISKQGSPIVK